MAKSKTLHVVPVDGGWAVREDGESGKTVHATQSEAIQIARHRIRNGVSGQFVVMKQNGQIVSHETYHLPKVQDPPGKRGSKKNIQRAAGRVAFKRVAADAHPPRA